MLTSHILCTVEAYYVSHDRPGSFGDELIVEGWFLSTAPVRDMRVVYPDQTEIPVEDRRRSSEGIFKIHWQFGEPAKNARFLLIEPLAGREFDFSRAILRISTGEHETLELRIGHLFRKPRPPEFTKDQHDLVMRFESLGDNCEFGLVQRRVGSERLSLLRYAGVGDVFALANSIENGFRGFAEDGDLGISEHVGEWMANVGSARLVFHTGRRVEQLGRDRILVDEARKLAFMAQKFVDDCESAEKIFIYRVHKDQRGGPDGTRGMDALYNALQTLGPVRVLWVNVEDSNHPHGTVEHVRDRLYQGYIDHLAPAWNAFDFKVTSWLDLLARAEAAILPGKKVVAPESQTVCEP